MNNFIFEKRLFNKYTLITAVSLFLTLALSWFFVSNLAEILWMDYGAPDLGGGVHAEVRAEIMPIFLEQIMNWEVLLMSSMAYVIHFIPLFFIFPTMTFAIEKKSYFVFGRHRFKSFSKSLLGAILRHSFISSLVSTSVFILFHALVAPFISPETLDFMTMYGSFLPADFYPNHPLLFVIFMFGTIYLALAFLFAFISCGVMLWIDRAYYGIAGIVTGYFLYLHAGAHLDFFLNLDFDLFFLGQAITAFNTGRTTSQVFIPLVPLALIGIVIVYWGIKKQEKSVSV